MNFLAPAPGTATEFGLRRTGPTSTSAQSGHLARILPLTNGAWLEIQNERRDWAWMRSSASFATVSGQATYTAAQAGVTDLGMWARDTFRNYVTTVGTRSEVFMDFLPYDAWRNTYQYGANRFTTSRPIVITITPAIDLGFGPVPSGDYTITGDYYRAPSSLAADTDTPSLPTKYHMAIVYRAMMLYGGFEAATEVYQRGELEYRRLMRALTADQLPEISFGGALC